ncbi:hypothetical protein DRP07_11910 [Archaeoglobales archaeon]|nr:MAG: hypothetical protein DRP07_11910 [Archaeoglobales archaeon]
MKTAVAVALLFAIALPSFAELTRQDVEQIIRSELEPIKKEITAIKLDIAEMRGEIKAVRAEMKTMATKDDIITLQRELTKKTDEMRNELAGKIEESNARVNSRIDSMYYQMWAIWTVIFVTILAAIFGGPIFAEWWRKKQERKDEINKMKEKAREIIKEHPEFAEVLRTIGLI